MTTVIIASSVNKKGINAKTGRPWRDATGAFLPGAALFFKSVSETQKVSLHRIDCVNQAMVKREALVLQALRQQPAADLVAFFCHGLRNSIQAGLTSANCDRFVKQVASAGGVHDRTKFIFYACSASSGPGPGGDGGFCDLFRDALCRHGLRNCEVYGHTTAGHAYKNPYVRVFVGEGSEVGGTGGSWLVAPGSTLWRRWRSRLANSDLWIRFAEMPIAKLHQELSAK
jgi:hypothetical protein